VEDAGSHGDEPGIGAGRRLPGLGLQRVSYVAGKSNLLQLIVAARLSQQSRLGYAQALAQRYQDTTLLLVAMGGGWWEADARLVGPRPSTLATP